MLWGIPLKYKYAHIESEQGVPPTALDPFFHWPVVLSWTIKNHYKIGHLAISIGQKCGDLCISAIAAVRMASGENMCTCANAQNKSICQKVTDENGCKTWNQMAYLKKSVDKRACWMIFICSLCPEFGLLGIFLALTSCCDQIQI